MQTCYILRARYKRITIFQYNNFIKWLLHHACTEGHYDICIINKNLTIQSFCHRNISVS